MGSIVKQPNRRWKARYRATVVAHVRRRSTARSTPSGTCTALAWSSTEARGSTQACGARFQGMGRYLWRTTVRLRPNTRRGYWILLQNHVLPYFGEFNMPALDHVDV